MNNTPSFSFSTEPEKLKAYEEALLAFDKDERTIATLPCPSLLCGRLVAAYDRETVEQLKNGKLFCAHCQQHGKSSALEKFHAAEPKIFREGATATDTARFNQPIFKSILSFFSRSFTPEAGEKTSLYIFGDTGSQKSRMLFRAMNPVFLRKRKTFKILRGGELRKMFSVVHDSDRFAGDKTEGVKKELMDVDLLVFDDFGQDRLTENMLADLWQILDFRFGEAKPTVFLSNVPPKDISERYKQLFSLDSLVRRIIEFSEIFAISKRA